MLLKKGWGNALEKLGHKVFCVDENGWAKDNVVNLCKNADLFIAENWNSKTIEFKNESHHAYSPNKASLARVERIAFFISKVSYPTPENKPIYSLYFLIAL